MDLHIIPSTIAALDQMAASHALDEYHAGIAHEGSIEPVTHLRGMRQYIHCKPFVLIPDITLTIGSYEYPQPDGQIGEVLGTQGRKHREVEIGQAQAWYYPADHLIVLWESFLHDFVRDKPRLVVPCWTEQKGCLPPTIDSNATPLPMACEQQA